MVILLAMCVLRSHPCYAPHMRAYKFLDSHFGLKTLYEKRLKQSRVNELNDPFELTPFDLTDLAIRNAFIQTREDLCKEKGVVCFSSGWRDPVIWAHYSDKHRGLCLGFEIPDLKGEVDDESGCVSYVEKPLHFPADFSELGDTERFEIIRRFCLPSSYTGSTSTKYVYGHPCKTKRTVFTFWNSTRSCGSWRSLLERAVRWHEARLHRHWGRRRARSRSSRRVQLTIGLRWLRTQVGSSSFPPESHNPYPGQAP